MKFYLNKYINNNNLIYLFEQLAVCHPTAHTNKNINVLRVESLGDGDYTRVILLINRVERTKNQINKKKHI